MLRVSIKQSMFRVLILVVFVINFLMPVKFILSKDMIHEKHDIKKVLEPDTILSIKNPQFVSASATVLHPDEPVIGLSINGVNRAYSVYLLNSHEIVNDFVGGKPVAVTW